MRKFLVILLSLLLLVSFSLGVGCKKAEQPAEVPKPAEAPAPAPEKAPAPAPAPEKPAK